MPNEASSSLDIELINCPHENAQKIGRKKVRKSTGFGFWNMLCCKPCYEFFEGEDIPI